MIDFVDFLLRKVYLSKPIPSEIIEISFNKACEDILYHFPNLDKENVRNKIILNSNELAIFLFRLGNEIHMRNLENLKPQIHWLLKELCCCEIYFNNKIDVGFYIVHGLSTVIGSRNHIGKGFVIHQCCTIGKRKNGEGLGCVIGDNVRIYANSSIIGDLEVGNNVIIGAHVLITSSLESDTIITSQDFNKIKKILK